MNLCFRIFLPTAFHSILIYPVTRTSMMIQLRLPGSRFNGSELMGYAAAIINFYGRETVLKIYKNNALFQKK